MNPHLFTRWRSTATNLAALTCLQASNAVIPLLIVPFAIARLGATAYADVAIAEAMSMIAVAAVLYSFEVDGVSRIAGLKIASHRAELSVILSAIFFSRLLIFVGTAAVLTLAVSLFTSLSPLLLACWLLVPLGQVLHSYWFYQGIEFNIPAAALTLLARVSSFVIVITCVHSAHDQLLVPLSIGAPFAIAGIASLLYKIRILGVRLRWVGWRTVLEYLTNGRRIFTGTAAVMLYRELNVVLMGVVGVPSAAISSYALAEKSIKMIQAVTRPLNQIAFPKVLRAIGQYDQPKPAAARVIMRYTTPQIVLVAALIIAVAASFGEMAKLLPSLARFKALPDFGLLFLIVAPAPLLGLANFMLGSAGLNFLNAQPYYLRAILVTGVVSLATCLILSSIYGAVGAAISFVGAEFTLLLLVIRRYGAGTLSMVGKTGR